MSPAEPLPTAHIAIVPPRNDAQRWLVEGIWTRQAVGFIAGPPKACKSWFGLDLAVSVASGTACLGRYQVQDRGPVLLYPAEDDHTDVRTRVAGICAHRGLALAALDLHLLHVHGLRLDIDEHRDRLRATIVELRPRLLLLDPLVRLHRLDENSAAEIARLLAYLRELQVRHGTAVAVVHHMGKRRRAQLGAALRGSSDLFAWADSNAYLVRKEQHLSLTLEHRAAPQAGPITLALVEGPPGAGPHLQPVTDDGVAAVPAAPLAEAVLQTLARTNATMTRAALRQALRVNNQRLGDTLHDLEQRRLIDRADDGWTLRREPHPAAATRPPSPPPPPPLPPHSPLPPTPAQPTPCPVQLSLV